MRRELQSLTENLEAAWCPATFSTAHTASSFEKHSLTLVQTIADSAVRLQLSSRSPLFDFDSL
jgi:hypothetical protein